jgi:transposase-like protein
MVRRCPRCHSSMLLDFGGPDGGWERAWKCLGCGREMLDNTGAQAADDRLLEGIRRDSVRGRTR